MNATGVEMAGNAEALEQWSGLLEAWRSSGKSLKAFAAERQVSYWSLQYWRGRIEGKKPKTKVAAKPGKRLMLIPVERSAVAASSMRGEGRAQGIVVRVGVGVEIEVGPGFDGALLGAVVQALRGAARC